MPTSISAVDIYDTQEFYLQLAKLIANNLYVNIWIFKIDDEFSSRGHAYINIDSIKSLADIRRKQVVINDELVDKVMQILIKMLPKKAKVSMDKLF